MPGTLVHHPGFASQRVASRNVDVWLPRAFAGADHSERAWRERVHIPLEFLLSPRSGRSAGPS